MTFEFDRYINGQLMAEGVTIERQGNLPDAMREAARIASRGPNGEVPVLVLRAEALSRTGAVKVKALDWEAREERRLGATTEKFWRAQTAFDWGYRVKAYGKGFSFDDATGYPTIDAAKAAAQADYERRILSALEPAAPEGRQPVGVVWFGYDENTGEFTGESCSVEPHDSHRFRAYAPITTRPAEQAVTEAMVRAAAEILIGRVNAPEQEIYSAAAAALKAAMEAGRHD